MRLHRLIAILLLLESRGSVKAKEMANALETSERTIYRDVDTLCEAGIPITATTGPTGGFSFMPGYSVNLKNFHCDDAISLFLSGIGLRPEGESEAGLKLKTALTKLETNLPPEYRNDIKAARERFYFEAEDWWKEKQPLVNQEMIRQAVWRSKKLAIDYRKAGEETRRRTVRPYGLVVKNADWYLVAYCESSKGLRIFKCERIIEAQLLEEEFLIPEEFSLGDFWRSNTERFKAVCREKDYYPVRLRIPEEIDVEKMRDIGLLLNTEEADELGRRIVTVNTLTFQDAAQRLPIFMDRVEVLEPQELREYIIGKIKDAARIYDNPVKWV